MDARQQKTLSKLRVAVIELATEGPVADVTVSQLAVTAAVHRSTIYAYASSPLVLLQQTLRAELDELRATYLVDVAPEDAVAAIRGETRAVLHHVDERDAIYRRGLGDASGSASLHAMLSEHFQESLAGLLDQHSVDVPAANDAERRMIGRYIADGIIGALDVWLHGDKPRDVESFVALLTRVAPPWWPA